MDLLKKYAKNLAPRKFLKKGGKKEGKGLLKLARQFKDEEEYMAERNGIVSSEKVKKKAR